MDVPASAAGTIIDITVEVGSTVNSGDVIGHVEPVESATTGEQSEADEPQSFDGSSTVVIEPDEQQKLGIAGGSLAGRKSRRRRIVPSS